MRVRTVLFVFILALCASATNLTGTIVDASGTNFNGYITFTLSSTGNRAVQQISSNSTIFNKRPIRFRVTNGKLPNNSFVIGNDDLRPSGTFYEVELYTNKNVLIADQFWSITGNNYDVGDPTIVNPSKFVPLYLWPTSTKADIANASAPPATLVSLQMSPAQPQVNAGQNLQLNLLAFFDDSSGQVVTDDASWSSSKTTVASVSSTGFVITHSTGSTVITASYTSNNKTLTLNVNFVVSAAVLNSLSLSPSAPIVPLSTTQQMTATGIYRDGSTNDLTDSVTWASTNPSVVSVSNSGLLTGLSQGSARISATYGAIVASTAVEVTPPTPSSLLISPASATVQPGQNVDFVAVGVYSDGSTHDLSSIANWSTSNSNIAVSQGGGEVNGVANGTATISATVAAGNKTLQASVPINVVSIAKQFTSGLATWMYSAASGNSVPVPTGLTFSLLTNDGNGYPIETTDGSNGCTTFTDTLIHPYGDSICVPNMPTNSSSGFTPSANGHLIVINNATRDYYDFWKLTVNSTGVPVSTNVGQIVTGNLASSAGTPGTTQSGITGLAGDITANDLACPTCLNHVLDAVVPSNMLNAQVCNQAPATNTSGTSPNGIMCAGGKLMLDPTFNYSGLSLSPAVSAIFRALQLYGAVVVDQGAVGQISFYTALQSQPNTTGLSLLDGHLRSYQFLPAGATLTVTPTTVNLVVGGQRTETATSTLTNGSQKVVTDQTVWASGNSNVATVTSTGTITAVGVGSTQISAVYNGLTAAVVVSVAPPQSGGGGGTSGTATLNVSPSNPSVQVGQTVNETATYIPTSGSSQNVTTSATWSSSNTSIATVSSSGVVTGVANGYTDIICTYSGITVQAVVTVGNGGGTQPPPASADGGPYGKSICPGCFFYSSTSTWIYGPSDPNATMASVGPFNGKMWVVPAQWGAGIDISNSSIFGGESMGINTNDHYYGNPIEHFDSSNLGANPQTWYFQPGVAGGGNISITVPSNFFFTPSCAWTPPSTVNKPGCEYAFDGHLTIIDDATGQVWGFGQLAITSQGKPASCSGQNVYSDGGCTPVACGSSSSSACSIRDASLTNLATGNPVDCSPRHYCGDSNVGLSGAIATIIPSGTPTNTGSPIQQGELDCDTCLNHGIAFVTNLQAYSNSVSLGGGKYYFCSAFPTNPYKADGSEGVVLFYTGDWQALAADPTHYSTAVVAIARALQLYGGYDTDSTGGKTAASFYTDYNSAPSLTGISALEQHMVLFRGSAGCTVGGN